MSLKRLFDCQLAASVGVRASASCCDAVSVGYADTGRCSRRLPANCALQSPATCELCVAVSLVSRDGQRRGRTWIHSVCLSVFIITFFHRNMLHAFGYIHIVNLRSSAGFIGNISEQAVGAGLCCATALYPGCSFSHVWQTLPGVSVAALSHVGTPDRP